MPGQRNYGIFARPTLVPDSDSPSVVVDTQRSNLMDETSFQQAEANIPEGGLNLSSCPSSSHLEEESGEESQVQSKKKNSMFRTVSPPTIGVMFVDQTPGGVLAKKLQEVEDRLAKASGYRIRMVELSGPQLSRLLPNTNPWHELVQAKLLHL